MENDNVSISEFLEGIGFSQEDIDDILVYATNETDKKVLLEKLKYLVSIGYDADSITTILEEDITFMTEPLELIKANVAVLSKFLEPPEIIRATDVTPELLTIPEGELDKNISLIGILFNDIDTVKIIIQDRGEILTYKPDYLSDKLTFFVNNGLKNKILSIIIENAEVFDLDNNEIDVEELK